jgi:hypothetical protein
MQVSGESSDVARCIVLSHNCMIRQLRAFFSGKPFLEMLEVFHLLFDQV